MKDVETTLFIERNDKRHLLPHFKKIRLCHKTRGSSLQDSKGKTGKYNLTRTVEMLIRSIAHFIIVVTI